MNFSIHGINKGKVVYWIDYHSFENTNGKRDGKQKAEEYCFENQLNPADIIKFDSRTERDYYEYLLGKQKEGKISKIGHHYTLKVQDGFVNANGDEIPPITYEADFIYFNNETGSREIVDVKGSEYFIDERFITIKQVFDYHFLSKGLFIKIILRRNKEWVEYHLGEKKKSQKLIKKQRNAITTLKKELHDKELTKNKIERYKARLVVLNGKEKLTKAEQIRKQEIIDYLKEQGVML